MKTSSNKYIRRGTMLVLKDKTIKTICIVTEESKTILEIKNIIVPQEHRRCGFGRAMIEFIVKKYRDHFDILQVGTGDSTATLSFYESCGFIKSHMVKNFFIDNYDEPIFEEGILLRDMIYLRRRL